jgi:hypothetical protein
MSAKNKRFNAMTQRSKDQKQEKQTIQHKDTRTTRRKSKKDSSQSSRETEKQKHLCRDIPNKVRHVREKANDSTQKIKNSTQWRKEAKIKSKKSKRFNTAYLAPLATTYRQVIRHKDTKIHPEIRA